MLTKKFWDTAKVVKAENYDPPGGYWSDVYCDTQTSTTHCGTAEFQGIHEKGKESGTIENIVAEIIENVEDNNIGHFIYYAPVDRQYARAIRLLRQVGFKKLSTFTHFDNLDRKPDYGRAQLWSLCLTHAEVKRLRELDGSVS